MTAIYKKTVKEIESFDHFVCDGCGKEGKYDMFHVFIAVHEQEEGGANDNYDYCETCLMKISKKLIAAGSKAPILTGVWND